MASYLPGPLERPPVSKGPNLNSLRAVFIYSGGYVLAKQLHRAHGHPERNTDSQLEEEDGPRHPRQPLLDAWCPIQMCKVGPQPKKLGHAKKPPELGHHPSK